MVMAENPSDETVLSLLGEVKRDCLAWVAAEKNLLAARLQSGVRRVELAAVAAGGALVAALVGLMTLANAAVLALSTWLGLALSAVIVGIAPIIAAALLVFWIRSLLRPGDLSGRAETAAKQVWSALNEPN
jgi:hypothetical protein